MKSTLRLINGDATDNIYDHAFLYTQAASRFLLPYRPTQHLQETGRSIEAAMVCSYSRTTGAYSLSDGGGGGGSGIAVFGMPWGFGEGGLSSDALLPKRRAPSFPLPSRGLPCVRLRPKLSHVPASPPPSSTATTSTDPPIHTYNELGFRELRRCR
jgi:hypothetical protein